MVNPSFGEVSATAVDVAVDMVLVGLWESSSSARKKYILIRNRGTFINWKGKLRDAGAEVRGGGRTEREWQMENLKGIIWLSDA